MKKPFLLFAVFIAISFWFSCTKDTAIAPPAAPVCDSTHVSYTKSIVPLMANNCTLSGCHDGNTSGANNLTNYITVKAEVATDSPSINSVLCRVQNTACGDLMPKGSYRGLNPLLIDTLKLWRSGGYCN